MRSDDERRRPRVHLPRTLGHAVADELRHAFSPPYEAPLVVVLNALLMAGAWFLLPPDWFFRVHTARFFPITLAVWMLADVPATNLLGSDAARMSVVLDQPSLLGRMLVAKNVVLWLLVAPVCVLVAVVVGTVTGESGVSVLATVSALLIVPFGALGLTACLGVLFPYHALTLKVRWEHRHPLGRMVARWLILVLVPYVFVPFVASVLVLPVLAGWRLTSGSWATRSDGAFVLGVLVLSLVATVAWVAGHALAGRLVARRVERLRAFLDDPLQG
jgi:hypothetical protein